MTNKDKNKAKKLNKLKKLFFDDYLKAKMKDPVFKKAFEKEQRRLHKKVIKPKQRKSL